ncbi:cation-translocating P-type ATPase [Nisaea denitrificans]|uniref:cation-translocating P-type ATPase n=1 Tax=Nisaea denitrificans TaxID=390877 RepID=UPI000418FB11|nr:cation-transporting P-type ATPase [Nisaea denitrificans]
MTRVARAAHESAAENPNRSAAETPHTLSPEQVLREYDVALDSGLNDADVGRRRRSAGPNRLRAAKRKNVWAILAAQIRSVVVYLLIAAATLSVFLGQWVEGSAILAVLVINSTIGFVTELRAVRSMEALRRLSKVQARLRRAGRTVTVPAEDIVPGDIVVLEAGDVIPADLRLVENTGLHIDESALTGESVPVVKSIEAVPSDAEVADRSCMAFKGTAVTSGNGLGVTVATGMTTELGQIAALADDAEAQMSPLEKRLDRLGGQLVFVTLGLTVLIAVTGLYAGQDLVPMVHTAIALAVAAVPEGLPIVATVALARGMWRMARRNALIKDLSAVETLGATTIILTDKTGTLTENRMSVVQLQLEEGVFDVAPGEDGAPPTVSLQGDPVDIQPGQPIQMALRVGVLCGNAELSETENGAASVGDPMETALLVAGRAADLDRNELLSLMPEVHEEPFATETRMMATTHATGDGFLVAVKGAPETVIEHCTHVLTNAGPVAMGADSRKAWNQRNEAMTSDGLRVLALAMKSTEAADEAPYRELTLIGLVGLLDPPRPDVADAIAACHSAGVRVAMLTGDHIGTAKVVASQVGLADEAAAAMGPDEFESLDGGTPDDRARLLATSIFARVSPKKKLELVSLYQQSGAIVAMTGDGVNDAPALKKADIGIAMGRRGTDVAREAADMVLTDDAFPSIVEAMRHGRIIFSNIRKFVIYLMSCNLSEILVIGVATLCGLPLPLLPLQILYLNLVTDVFPAFALGVGEGGADVMRRPPRHPKEPILDGPRWLSIALFAAAITAGTLGAFIIALKCLAYAPEDAVTIAFLALAFAQLWHVFNMRNPGTGLIRNEITANPYVWGALLLCAALIMAAVYLPGLSSVIGLQPPGVEGWVLSVGASLVPALVGPGINLVTGHFRNTSLASGGHESAVSPGPKDISDRP